MELTKEQKELVRKVARENGRKGGIIAQSRRTLEQKRLAAQKMNAVRKAKAALALDTEAATVVQSG